MKRKNNRVTLVIFSYNRANQLNFLLKSVVKKIKHISYPIHIILKPSLKHEKSYDLLKKNWRSKIKIYRRKKINYYSLIKDLIFWPLNLVWLFRWPSILTECNNFKSILQKIIIETKDSFIMISTDDQYIYKKTHFPEKVFSLLREHKEKITYRFNTSDKFKDENRLDPKMEIKYFDKNKKSKFFKWYNNDKYAKYVWKYRFHVDGSIYHRSSLLSFIKRFIFNNPITLEGIGLWESRFRNYFAIGLSSATRSNIGIQANNIQKLVNTPRSYFNINVLRIAFENGYNFHIKNSDIDENKHIYVPKDIFFIKNGKIFSYNWVKKKLNSNHHFE